jgi:hypothetical protein
MNASEAGVANVLARALPCSGHALRASFSLARPKRFGSRKMLATRILGSKLQRRLLGFVLGAAVGIGLLVAVKRPEKSPPVVNKDGYWLPLFVQCTPPETCEGTKTP